MLHDLKPFVEVMKKSRIEKIPQDIVKKSKDF